MGSEQNKPTSTSREVRSSQRGVHPGLGARVQRQARSTWKKPPQEVDRAALASIDKALSRHEGPIVLDSFCGTGMSTSQLGTDHPDALVIGIDQSAHRLDKHPELPPNCLIMRAHCEAVWRHLAEAGLLINRHTIFYPNPWPKPGHLGRRIHGHPAFHYLAELGGDLELRSNWQIYVEEFGVALNVLGHASSVAMIPNSEKPITLFEQKYRRSGHALWRLQATFPG